MLDRKLLNGEREEKPKVILQLNPGLESTRFIEKDPSWLGNSNSGAQGKECPVLSTRESSFLLFNKLLLQVSNLAFLFLCGVGGRVSVHCVRCMALKRLGLNERAVFIEVCILRTSSTCLRLPCVCIAMTCPCRACRSVQNMPVVGLVTPFSLKEESRPE